MGNFQFRPGTFGTWDNSGVARKPTLSPTKISTYLACPDKYKWTYIDDRGKWYVRSKSYYSFGTSLHRILQRFHDEGDSGVTTTHQAVAALEESWIDAGYASQEEMMQALSEGKDILETYIEGFRAQPVTAKTLYIEKRLRMDMGDFDLIGQVDRVDEHDGGGLEIIDYKSGRTSVEPEDISTDLAMNCYALLLAECHPNVALQGTIIAIRTGHKATHVFDVESLNEFKMDLTSLGNEILARDYESLVPVKKTLCGNDGATCDFLPLCSKHPEFSV